MFEKSGNCYTRKNRETVRTVAVERGSSRRQGKDGGKDHAI